MVPSPSLANFSMYMVIAFSRCLFRHGRPCRIHVVSNDCLVISFSVFTFAECDTATLHAIKQTNLIFRRTTTPHRVNTNNFCIIFLVRSIRHKQVDIPEFLTRVELFTTLVAKYTFHKEYNASVVVGMGRSYLVLSPIRSQ